LEVIHQTSQKAGKSKQYFIILAWIIPIILIISLFVFFRLRRLNKVNEEELVQVEQKLNEKQYLLRANLIQKISETKAQQNRIYNKVSLAEREALHKEVYNKCLHLNNWDEFAKLINHVYNNLIYELESNYPDITHKEITLCCLFLLDVPTPDVLLVLDYKLDSLYKLKQRLIQKLNLKNAKELDLFLEDLVEIK
jgi:ATP-dependent Zn protease